MSLHDCYHRRHTTSYAKPCFPMLQTLLPATAFLLMLLPDLEPHIDQDRLIHYAINCQTTTYTVSHIVNTSPSTSVCIFTLNATSIRKLQRKDHDSRPHSLLIAMLLVSGDIDPNPGPVRYPCAICARAVASNHRSVNCDQCNSWVHIKCGNVTPK